MAWLIKMKPNEISVKIVDAILSAKKCGSTADAWTRLNVELMRIVGEINKEERDNG